MKHSLLFLLFIFVFAGSLLAFNGDNDSLLFDGAFEKRRVISEENNLECNVKVTYSNGDTKGTKIITQLQKDCGDEEFIVRKTEVGQLKKGDVLAIGEEISTGNDGYLEIELYDGSVLRLPPNSKIKIDEMFCETFTTKITAITGSVWSKIKKLVGGGKFEVTGIKGWCGVRGTEFIFDTQNDKDIIKVYEGSVEIKLSNNDEMEETGEEIEKITEEYENGKLTLQEYMEKISKYTTEIGTIANETNKTVLIESGNMSIVSKRISDPEPIPADDNRWFEDSKFIK